LSTTSTLSILDSVSTILQNALSDSNYNFPTTSTLTGSDSVTSFQHANNSGLGHTKSFSGSVSSLTPSMAANAPRDQVVDDLGMRGLMDLSFGGKGERERERIVVGARWVAALIDQFTS
jgi:neurofibromin 1